MIELRRILTSLLASSACIVLACSDSDDSGVPAPSTRVESATTVASPTDPGPSKTALACDIQPDACSVGSTIEDLIQNSNVDGLFAISEATSFACPDPTVIDQLAITANICEGVPEGEIRLGYVVSGLQSEISAFDESGFKDWLLRKSTQMGADVTFAAVGCPAIQDSPDCSGAIAVVLANGGDARLLIQFTLAPNVDGYRITHTTSGVISLNEVMVRGGVVNRRLTDDSADNTIYLPVAGP